MGGESYFFKYCRYSSLDLLLYPFKLRSFHFLMYEVIQDCRSQITLNSLLNENLHVILAKFFFFFRNKCCEKCLFNNRFFFMVFVNRKNGT